MNQTSTQPTKPGPLEGVRILDLTSVVFGPYATQMLGDLGADVIKLEPPEGDILRGVTPTRSDGMGVVFVNTNRNKRSVVLDLKQASHHAALLKLVGTVDVFIHSIRPRAAAKLRITHDDLKVAKPDLIHCTAVGFSSAGPYAESPAYDDVIQALSGTADLLRRQRAALAAEAGDEPGAAEPAYYPSAIADKTGAHFAAQAILAALFHRERTGEGQAIEVAMFEAMTSYIMLEHLYGEVHQPGDGNYGYNRVLAPHRRPHRTADGHIVLLPFSTKHWRAFFTCIGRGDMVKAAVVNDAAVRSPRIGELYAMISEVTPTRTTAEWLELMREADVPCMPVNRLEDLARDPHLAATGFFVDVAHPTEGRIRTTAPPLRLASTPASATRRPTPRLGEHTAEVLREAGLSDHEIAGLEAASE